MSRPTFSDLLLLQHLASSCARYGKQYITQSRATQRAGVLKGYDVAIPESTFDRSIRHDKERGHIKKRHRSGAVNGEGYAWKTSLTYITWAGVMFLWRLYLLPKEKFEALKRIFGRLKNGRPENANGPPARTHPAKRGLARPSFAVPT